MTRLLDQQTPQGAALVKPLTPPAVAVHEGGLDQIAGRLWPEESALCAQAVEKRRREFGAGRTLARRALAELGGPDLAILTRPGSRAPAWPAGFIGSISHTSDYAVAAVARLGDLAGIGVDVEDWRRLGQHLEPRILTARELDRELAGLEADARRVVVAILFSAKEAFYKLQHPLTSASLGFCDVEVEIDAGGAFQLVCLKAEGPFASGRSFEGRYAVAGERVATAIWLDAGWR